MKKLFIIYLAAVLVGSLWSCSEDTMDDINKNINNPTDVESKLIITDVMTSTAFSVVGSDLAFYASVYIEHNTGVYGQLYNAEIRSGEPSNSTTFNNSWDALYQNLYRTKLIIEKCSVGGSEEGNYHTLGIAQILAAYNLAVLTDLFGDVPWSEALQPAVIFTPKLDGQEGIYTDVFKFLDEGISNLKKESTFAELGTQDFIYGTSNDEVGSWLKFAYGLKSRYLMRLSNRQPEYAKVIAYADSSFASSAEQCKFSYNGATSTSPFYAFYTDRNYFGASLSLHNKLAAESDPRDTIFFVVHPEAVDQTTIIYAPNGAPKQLQNLYSISALTKKTAPTYLLSYHELQFIKAEANARLGHKDEADSAMKKGIIAAFTKGNVGLKASDAIKYYTNSVKSRFDANPLKEIMFQKYFALFEEEAIEAYNDYRRWDAMGDNAIKLENALNSSKFPVRYAYGSDDVTTNHNVATAYGDGSYVYSSKVWWAGGSN